MFSWKQQNFWAVPRKGLESITDAHKQWLYGRKQRRWAFWYAQHSSAVNGANSLVGSQIACWCAHARTHARTHTHTHTHTHTFNGPFSRTTQVGRYQKGKPNRILLKQETVSASGISWAICKSAPCSRQITTPAPHHSVFYRPDALPAAQPTASKYWRHWRLVDEKNRISDWTS